MRKFIALDRMPLKSTWSSLTYCQTLIVATKSGNMWACHRLRDAIIHRVQQEGPLPFDAIVEFATEYLVEQMRPGVPDEAKQKKFASVASIFATIDPSEGPKVVRVGLKNENHTVP